MRVYAHLPRVQHQDFLNPGNLEWWLSNLCTEDYWGTPFLFLFNIQVFYFRYALCKECIFVLSLKRVFIIKTDMFVGTSVIYAVFSLFSPCLWLWELFTILFFSSVLEGLVRICILLAVIISSPRIFKPVLLR